MKFFIFTVVFTMILISPKYTHGADGPNGGQEGTWADYGHADHFQWTNYDNGVHILGAYSIALTSGLFLEHKMGFKRWEAALLGVTLAGMIGTAKETFFDGYAMRTDIKCWWGGAAAAGLTMTVLEF